MKKTMHCALAMALPTLLSGCYIVPVGPEAMVKLNSLLEQAHAGNAPTPPAKPNPAPSAPAAPAAAPAPTVPTALQARLYPVNEIATENGMVAGTVTNMMNGKGRLQLSYRG